MSLVDDLVRHLTSFLEACRIDFGHPSLWSAMQRALTSQFRGVVSLVHLTKHAGIPASSPRMSWSA